MAKTVVARAATEPIIVAMFEKLRAVPTVNPDGMNHFSQLGIECESIFSSSGISLIKFISRNALKFRQCLFGKDHGKPALSVPRPRKQ